MVATCTKTRSSVYFRERWQQSGVQGIRDLYRYEPFPNSDHFTARCGIAPGNNGSAGKRKNTLIKKGNSYLRVAIVGAAWVTVRMKDSYWHALFDKSSKRMKAQKAIVAVARRLLKVVYNTLETLTIYKEKGIAHFVYLQAKAALYHNTKLSCSQTTID
ncbi:transposase [Arcticibacter eurypsychrophilus]|uniref:transposase n=1 Tax=Arcticibacter eurypsychrophilus TaxID=1434752 RepID=UPI00147E4506|nr:transposase [Arcticibacter eurypsychrophilus]